MKVAGLVEFLGDDRLLQVVAEELVEIGKDLFINVGGQYRDLATFALHEEVDFTGRKDGVSDSRDVYITVITIIFTSSFGVLHCGHVRNSCLQRRLKPAQCADVVCNVDSDEVAVVADGTVCFEDVELCIYCIDIPTSKHDVIERKHSSHMSLSSTIA